MAARDRTARYSAPPAQLVSSIDAAVRKYPNVTRDELLGIWRIESGSTFPNPYRNKLGYGGLFGTTDWNGDPAGQAMYAASILSRLIVQHQGDLSAALYAYSGGGYTSVSPGPAFGTRGPRPVGAAGGGGEPSTPGGGGFFSWVGHEAGAGFDALTGGINGVVDFLKMAAWLVNPLNWLRAAEFLVGVVVMLMGLYFYGSATGSSSPASKSMPLKVPGLGGVAAAAVKGTKRARAGRRSSSSSSSAPRRKGDAAARRGEEVTRTGPAGPVTTRDKVQRRRNASKRRKAESRRRRDVDAKYGDIPF